MKISSNLEKWVFSVIITYCFVNILLAMISPGLVNRYVLVILVMMYIYYNKKVACKKIGTFFAFNVLLISYTCYYLISHGISMVFHSDYYSFVLIILLFFSFSDQGVRQRFTVFFRKFEKMYMASVISTFVALIVSIAFLDGLHKGFGISLPILYGPYSVPHELGYALTGMYCGLGLLSERNEKKIKVLKIICVILVIWTAARSAVIAIALVICADYLSIKRRSLKLIIGAVLVCAGLYIFLFTDVLYNNPLMQKTLLSISNGSITNGRERFASIILDYYSNNTSIIQKILGIGMGKLREIMLYNPTIGVGIHAHNDYVNALVGFGVFGLIVFVIGQTKMFIVAKSKPYALMLEMLIFILAFYNGIAMYTVFTPILIIVALFFDRKCGELIKC